MEAILKKAEEQGVWEEPTDPTVAKEILNRIDFSDIISTKTPNGHIRRLDQLGWKTLANDFYAKRQQQLKEPPRGDYEETDDDGMVDV